MSGEGVHKGEMRERDELDDEALEALRQGRTPQGRGDLAALASLISDLRVAHQAEPIPPMSPELADVVRTAAAGDPSPAEVTPVSSPPVRSGWLKLLIGAAVGGLGLVGGLGAAGALPAPMQRMFASTAEVVGFEVPRPPSSPPAGPSDPSASPPPPPATTTTTTCPTPTSSPPPSPAPPPSSEAGQVPPRPGTTSPLDAACAASSTSTSTTRPGSRTTGAAGPSTTTTTTTTTIRSSPTTTAAATTSTTVSVDR